MIKNKDIFQYGLSYLLSFDGVTEELLYKHINFPEWNKPKDLPTLYQRMLNHATNRQGMQNSIKSISDLKGVLYNFNVKKVLNEYRSWEMVFDRIKRDLKPASSMEKDNKHNYWVIFSKSILSIAQYINRFKSIDEFNAYVNGFITEDNPDTRIALPLILKEEIFGYQFALACDFIKENISPYFVKPDTHIKDIFIGLGMSEAGTSDFQIFRDVIEYAESIDEDPYTVDKLFWLIGSGNFHHDNFKIKTNKHQFMENIKSLA